MLPKSDQFHASRDRAPLIKILSSIYRAKTATNIAPNPATKEADIRDAPPALVAVAEAGAEVLAGPLEPAEVETLFPPAAPVAAGPEPDLVGMYDPVPVARMELLLLPYGAPLPLPLLPDEATAVEKEDAPLDAPELDVAEADALLEVEEVTLLQERS